MTVFKFVVQCIGLTKIEYYETTAHSFVDYNVFVDISIRK